MAGLTHAATVPLPPQPERGIVPGEYPAAPPRDPIAVPEDILARREHLTLSDVLAVALANDPTTRIAWRDARARVAQIGIERGDYYPQIDATVAATRSHTVIQGGRLESSQTISGPGATLDWLLLDFGERSGSVETARRQALSAVWSHGAVVQGTLLRTIEAYVDYVGAKANLAASKTSRSEAQTNLDAAQGRRDAGVATIADVLQAKTALSQATLFTQTISGSIGSLRGALATAMGIPANVPFDVEDLPAEVPSIELSSSVDELIERAKRTRSDLASSREDWLAAKADIKTARGAWLPKLEMTGALNRNSYSSGDFSGSGTPWSLGVVLRIPVFDGLRAHYDIARAKETERAAAEVARALEQDVVNDVWRSYYDLQTAAQRIATAKDLLESATESEKVALGRYTEGVGTLLDLLNAQSALAAARAQDIAARADWFVSAARLLHATGGLTSVDAINEVRR
ncbi:MAG TPA: TolC family protein [Candidatus Polarisedimenticolaceae bacterium]|nr:TolC family protein [Candidatus Polarisedimenticolaceae bacterium]